MKYSLHKRRHLGTVFVSFMCLVEVIWFGICVYRAKPYRWDMTETYVLLLFALTWLYKLGFHIWMLVSPSLTAGNGDAVKLNVFLAGTLILNMSAVILGLVSDYLQYKRWNLSTGLVSDYLIYKSGLNITNFDTLFLLPAIIAIFERFAYSKSDFSASRLKNWKPWTESQEAEDYHFARRPLGTAFVSVLCVPEIVFAFVVVMLSYKYEFHERKMMDWMRLSFVSNLLYKLGFHLWILADPKLTANRGDPLKLNIFTGGSLMLSAFTAISLIIDCDSTRQKYLWGVVLLLTLPGIAAIGERFIYGLPEDSSSCFKNLKPWSVPTEKTFKF